MLFTMLLMWYASAQEPVVPPHVRVPVFGTVHKDRFYGLFDTEELGYCLDWVDLKKSGPGSKGRAYPVSWPGAYDRFQIRCGSFLAGRLGNLFFANLANPARCRFRFCG